MKSPNIIFFVSDQFRKSSMGFWREEAFKNYHYGESDPVHTPNLNKFAKESLILPYATSTFPLCSPYRGMMFSGKLPYKNGVVLNCNSNRPVSGLREDITCISDVLSKNNYSLGYIGKLHTDFPTPNSPQSGTYAESPREDGYIWDTYTPPGPKRHGFDYWYSYGAFDNHKNPHYWDRDGEYYEPQVWSAEHEVDKACSYIKNDKNQRDPDKSFALWVSVNPPHNPYNSLDDCQEEDYMHYRDKTLEELNVKDSADINSQKIINNLKYYFASVTGIDRVFGKLLTELDSEGLSENTIVIFTSDHGDSMGAHNQDAKNHPFNESIEVPFLVRYPKSVIPRVDETMFETCDIMPTLLGLCGLNKEIPSDIDGNNYSDLFLKSKSNNINNIGCLIMRNINGERDDSNRVIGYVTDLLGIKTREYTLCLGSEKSKEFDLPALYHNTQDPYQLNNIFNRDSDIVKVLSNHLKNKLPMDFPYDKLDSSIVELLKELSG